MAPPGWKTFTNDYLGYQFSYPYSVTLYDETFIDWSNSNVIPAGFSEREYASYLYQVIPDYLCLSFGNRAGWVTIKPPSNSIGQLVEICPGLGMGPIDRREEISETFQINGRNYLGEGLRIFFTDYKPAGNDLFGIYIDGGFQIIFSTAQKSGITSEEYSTQREILKDVLSTLTWFKVPDLTMPGTTCAGKYTHLLPGVYAIVIGKTDDPPNRVRSVPSKTSEVITQIYPQTIVKVLEGPICADGLVFWKVENSTISGGFGWTSEGDGKEYWLEPYKP